MNKHETRRNVILIIITDLIQIALFGLMALVFLISAIKNKQGVDFVISALLAVLTFALFKEIRKLKDE